MSEIKHTPEPWEIEGQQYDAHRIVDVDGLPICQLWYKDESPMPNQEANAERIVSCVNAMKGIDDPQKLRQAWDVVKDLELDTFPVLQEERNELLECLKDMLQRFQACVLGGSSGLLSDDRTAIKRTQQAIETSFRNRAIGK